MGIIDGKMVASQIKENITTEVQSLKKKTGKSPGLAVVLVGDDPASAVYVRNKNKTCNNIGFQSFENILPANTSESELLNLIHELNNKASEMLEQGRVIIRMSGTEPIIRVTIESNNQDHFKDVFNYIASELNSNG